MSLGKKRTLLSKHFKEVATLCAGVALLVGAALVLSGHILLLSQNLKLALQSSTKQSQTAAVWQSQLPCPNSTCNGYPSPHTVQKNSNDGTGDAYKCGLSFTTPLAYEDTRVGVISTTVEGKSLGQASYYVDYGSNKDSTGITVVQSGTSVVLEYACQDTQTVAYWSKHGCGQSDIQCKCDYDGVNTYTFADEATLTGPGAPSGTLLPIGSATVPIIGTNGSTVNYTLSCKNSSTGKSWNVTAPIHISSAVMSISASPSIVNSGTASTLSFSATKVTSCTVTGPGVSKSYPSIGNDYSYTGSDQQYIVPAGLTSLAVSLWGAGGFGYRSESMVYAAGGGGGYVTGVLGVTPGSTLTIIAGQGGSGNQAVYGGGAKAGGGGRSAIRIGSSEIITAGGGGGGSNNGTYGGAGGGLDGQRGGTAFAPGGFGGGQTGGGSGIQFNGSGTSNGYYFGGGGGWFGGQGATELRSGGGGGSSHCSASVTGCFTVAGDGANPGFPYGLPEGYAQGTFDYNYPSSAFGGNGFVKIFGSFASSQSTGNLTSATAGVVDNTATYTLSCQAVDGVEVATTTTVAIQTDSCPTVLEVPTTGAFVLHANATRRLNSQGYNTCLKNSGANEYFIPGKTKAEIDSFINNFPSGVSQF